MGLLSGYTSVKYNDNNYFQMCFWSLSLGTEMQLAGSSHYTSHLIHAYLHVNLYLHGSLYFTNENMTLKPHAQQRQM